MNAPTPRRRRRGFTLVELLVVIGILFVLAALLLPGIAAVRREADRTAQRAALTSIAQALDAYQGDFRDLPRFSPGFNEPNDYPALNESGERGARLLARAMFGPAPKVEAGLDAGTNLPSFLAAEDAFMDGKDGFGFKPVRQVVTGSGAGSAAFYLPGKVYGPYLDPDRWRLRQQAGGGYGEDAVILDRNDQPVLYYPARRKQPDIYVAPFFVAAEGPTSQQSALYNAFDNADLVAVGELRQLLGDSDADGAINGEEEAVTTGPFLLVATDDLGEYGPGVVANFDPDPAADF